MEEIVARDRTPVMWIIVLSVAAILITWIVASPNWVAQQVGQEGMYVESMFGRDVSDKVMGNATDLGYSVYRRATRSLSRKATSRWGMTRGQTARLLLTLILVRIQNALLVAWMLLPVILAAAIDGWTQRAVAQHAGAYINPVRFNIGFILLHVSFWMPAVFIAIPLAVHPLFFAVYWLIVAMGAYTAIKYLHHRI